ncbi:HET-domain-containing protein [Parathielavia appendiculata]|uniref:HET-domain-containing protein n=1 Tax=Parathielavia appendiculata TaxID=2587402 RepID=A0AAN6Z4A5_9PEZI|nr:HET-domain-containing protein [Parathielavia appendiculata]
MKSTTDTPAVRPFTYDSAPLDKSKPEIRRLELFPSPDRSAPLTGHILVSTLPTTPGRGHTQSTATDSLSYTALSYTWGKDPTTTHSIFVVGSKIAHGNQAKQPELVNVQSRLAITKNLHITLVHLRDEREKVVLWIDQVCINQEDGTEKGAQVQLMGRIYAEARQVLVWLGPEEDGSDEVMDAWRVIGQDARNLEMEKYYTLEKWPALSKMIYDPDLEDALTQEYQNMLERAMNVLIPLIRDGRLWKWFCRPWFGRAWVVQEFCLCDNTILVCGKKRLDPKLVFLAQQIHGFSIGRFGSKTYLQRGVSMEQLNELSGEPTSSLFTCRQRRRNFDRAARAQDEPRHGAEGEPRHGAEGEPRHGAKGESRSGARGDQLHALLKKLYVEHSVEATEHRDRIYSLLALAVDTNGENALDIRPDYTDMGNDEKTARILTDAARQMITHPTSGRIDILCCTQFPKTPGRDGRLADYLPSWVPDWRSNLQGPYYKINETTETHTFAACGDYLDVQPVFSADPRALGLRGFIVDVIEMVSQSEPLAWTGDFDAAIILDYFSWINTFVDISLAKATPEAEGAYPSRERMAEARWRVPIADLYGSRGNWSKGSYMSRAPPKAEQYHKQAVEALQFILECATLSIEEQSTRFAEFGWEEKSGNQQTGADYRHSLSNATNKRPFLTQNGHVGIASGETKAGDMVVIFCGGRIPFILRPLGQPKDKFAFIGEAYCDGIMDGEFAREGRLQDLFLF